MANSDDFAKVGSNLASLQRIANAHDGRRLAAVIQRAEQRSALERHRDRRAEQAEQELEAANELQRQACELRRQASKGESHRGR